MTDNPLRAQTLISIIRERPGIAPADFADLPDWQWEPPTREEITQAEFANGLEKSKAEKAYRPTKAATTQQWYFQSGNDVLGPISPSDLKSMAAAGTLHAHARVRLGEVGDWMAADTVKGLTFGGEQEPEEAKATESERRYPHLQQYLFLFDSAIEIGTGLAGLALMAGIAVGLLLASQREQGGGLVVAGTLVCGSLYGALLFCAYVGGKATIEFIRVVIDVERNTRRIAARLKRE
jgi:uncharacterized protein DUF4339